MDKDKMQQARDGMEIGMAIAEKHKAWVMQIVTEFGSAPDKALDGCMVTLAAEVMKALGDQQAEVERLRQWLACIERLTDEEIGARFRTSSNKSEEQMAGKSVVYTMLSIPRNLARGALSGKEYIKKVANASSE